MLAGLAVALALATPIPDAIGTTLAWASTTTTPGWPSRATAPPTSA
jgi:predicted MFS family arabinose efflux permease